MKVIEVQKAIIFRNINYDCSACSVLLRYLEGKKSIILEDYPMYQSELEDRIEKFSVIEKTDLIYFLGFDLNSYYLEKLDVFIQKHREQNKILNKHCYITTTNNNMNVVYDYDWYLNEAICKRYYTQGWFKNVDVTQITASVSYLFLYDFLEKSKLKVLLNEREKENFITFISLVRNKVTNDNYKIPDKVSEIEISDYYYYLYKIYGDIPFTIMMAMKMQLIAEDEKLNIYSVTTRDSVEGLMVKSKRDEMFLSILKYCERAITINAQYFFKQFQVNSIIGKPLYNIFNEDDTVAFISINDNDDLATDISQIFFDNPITSKNVKIIIIISDTKIYCFTRYEDTKIDCRKILSPINKSYGTMHYSWCNYSLNSIHSIVMASMIEKLFL